MRDGGAREGVSRRATAWSLPVAPDRRLRSARFEPGVPRTRARYRRSSKRACTMRESWAWLRCARPRAAPRSRGSEAMDDPGPFRVADRRAERPQCVHQRRLRPPGSRVDGEAGRLVHDEQVLVLVGDQAGNRRCRGGLGHVGQLGHDCLAAFEPVALRPRLPVHAHRARREQALGCPPRSHLGTSREHPVEPGAGVLLRNAEAERRQPGASAWRDDRSSRA